MPVTIAINGFGRIGRCFLRTILLDSCAREKITVAAINVGPRSIPNLDILFAHDSTMGKFPGTVTVSDTALTINGLSIGLFAEGDATKLPWKKLGIDWVVDASGHYTEKKKALEHCAAGAKKVLITAPSTDEDITIIPGINDAAYDANRHQVVSMGSCTTNCFAPIVKVLHESFGITSGLMNTVHAYTNDQVLLDVEHKDPRRARAAAINIIPTKTGADKVITKIFPELTGKIRGSSLRVPVASVSMLDFAFTTNAQNLTPEIINKALEKYAHGQLKSIMQYETAPLVSSDFIGNSSSCIVDSLLTQCAGNVAKVCAWYDNEYGYSCRLKDFLLHNG